MAEAKNEAKGMDTDEMKTKVKALSAQEIKDIKLKFKMFDEDGGGSIDLNELAKGFSKLNLHFNKSEMVGLMKHFDADGNGEIDFDEFCVLFAPGVIDDYRLHLKFNEFDVDGGGSLDPNEIKKMLKAYGITLSDNEIDALIKKVDDDGNGEIEFSEFKALMDEISTLKLKEIFKKYDKDNGGTIDENELGLMLKDMGVYIPDDKVKLLLSKVDDDGNGEIDFNEFKVLMNEVDKYMRIEFNKVDNDGSGLIDKNECKKMLLNYNITMDDNGLTKIFNEVDADGNGELDFDEYKVLLSKLFENKKDIKIITAKYLLNKIIDGTLKLSDDNYKELIINFDKNTTIGKQIITNFDKSVKDGNDFYVKIEEIIVVMDAGKQVKSRKVVGYE